MSKRKHNRAKRKAKGKMSLPEAFFSTILPFIENLEKEEDILLVLPSENNRTMGCVMSGELTNAINVSYLRHMADGTRLCGGLESFLTMRAQNPKFARKHNPDQFLLNICLAARYVIAYRYGLQIGTSEFMAQQEVMPAMPSLEEMPLFITMLGEESQPLSVGYELDGVVVLERYEEKMKPEETVKEGDYESE